MDERILEQRLRTAVEHTTPEGYAQFMQATRQPPHQEQER